MKRFSGLIIFLILAACSGQSDTKSPASDAVTITVIGTNDVHGDLLAGPGKGGLATFSGYVDALRSLRSYDGALLLIDAGDMWQGTLESNLVEGRSVVEAYNAMQYTAVTIGNHEFDFGPVGRNAIPANDQEDPRGALKERARESKFPVLTANIIDSSTGEIVAWDNVSPSVMVEAAGVDVGIIGLVTKGALQVTATANTVGLEIAPLAAATIEQARLLRADGADIVIVTAHAGGGCEDFSDPYDASSCRSNAEIMRLARALPTGLVDLIVAGHEHQGIAHFVNDIVVVSGFSNTHAFDRVDITVNPSNGAVLDRKIFPPQLNCPAHNRETGDCEWLERNPAIVEPPVYEGIEVVPNLLVEAIVADAVAHTEAIKSEPLGVYLETPLIRDNTPESPIARLFTDAILEEVDADISIHNTSGGIRADLQAGPLTFGDIYQISPFDNQVVILDMSGTELRRIIEAQATNTGRRAGFSGMRVFVDCVDGDPSVEMVLNKGHVIQDDDRVRVSTNDFLATLGDGILSPGMPAGGYQYEPDSRMNRDLIVSWLRKRGGSLSHRDYEITETNRRWNFSDSFVAQCQNGV
ncbi:MAG: 5'-nucleotidase C-terminal domain-containing protein [Woeseiaceae bacterium]